MVLGIAADLANKFLPNMRADFSIFSIVVSSLSILVLTFLLLRSQPRVDAVVVFIIGVLWLSLAAWTVDIIGNVQCFTLGGQTINISEGRKFSAAQYCREMKAIEAFSWAIFTTMAIGFIILIALSTRAQSIGIHRAWARSISELPWWGENEDGEAYYAGYGNSRGRGIQYATAQPAYGNVIHQQPGHSIVIQPGPGGSRVQQVPGTAVPV